MEKFVSGKPHLVDTFMGDPQKSQSSEEVSDLSRKEKLQNMRVVELTMQRWSGQHSRPFLFGILNDGMIFCYHAYLYESMDSTSKTEVSASSQNTTASRLRNLRFVRVPLDTYSRNDLSNGTSCQRMTVFKNIAGNQGLFLAGSRPAWLMVFRERIRVHPQVRKHLFLNWGNH